MNKNDFEVYIFYEYLKDPKHANMSDYALSLALKIPKTKVKRLRYEAGLKYPLSEDQLKKQFEDSLQYARIIPKSERCIEINIESESVRQYVDSLLKKEHRFSDGSFSSDILRITADDYEYLVTEIYGKVRVDKVTNNLLALEKIKELGLSKDKSRLKDILEKISKRIPDAINISITFATIVKEIVEKINL